MVNSKNKWTFSPLVGAVFNRTESALFLTVPTKRENGKYGFLTAPVWSVSLILKSTIVPWFVEVLGFTAVQPNLRAILLMYYASRFTHPASQSSVQSKIYVNRSLRLCRRF